MTTSHEQSPSIDSLLNDLRIPSHYNKFSSLDVATDSLILAQLTEWKRNVSSHLKELLAFIEIPALTQEQRADVASVVAQFDGDQPWATGVEQLVSLILDDFQTPSISMIRHILTKTVKPVFQGHLHPSLNPSTGRTLPRLAGGPSASHDMFESQTWKDSPGIPNLLSCCIGHMPEGGWDDVWHLIIPPMMTLLDDYEAKYKVIGANLVHKMLQSVPKSLLQRTGVDGLLRSSLHTCLAHLQRPESPALIQTAVKTSVSLILLTTDIGSQHRFDHLCALLGDGIIGSIWLYSSLDLDTVQSSVEALPLVIDALGIGCSRYLKALIPQLVHPLSWDDTGSNSLSFQIYSIQALRHVITACSPRIHRWKGIVLEGIGKAWVTLLDTNRTDDGAVLLKSEIALTCEELARACPSVVREELPALCAAEPTLFTGLVRPIIQFSSNPSMS